MNRLQGLDSAEQYLVTLNARDRIDPAKVIAVMDYEHPIYDLAAIEAQRRLTSLSTPRTAFAGAYHGWGFHEDGCRSGVEAARQPRGRLVTDRQTMTTLHDATTNTLPVLPAIVDGVVAHRRRGPIRHEFRHRAYQWLVDLDELPRPPWYLRPVAGFDARDHLGGNRPDASRDIKRNVERFLALARRRPRRERADRHARQCPGLRPRVRPADRLLVLRHRRHAALCGGRGAQHLRRTPRVPADARTPTGKPASNKQFYVSPFNDVSGTTRCGSRSPTTTSG